ncbi:MAG TPA: RNB domain-containing ribonuclease [Thermoanaerobaculia bacterium]|nr:RNB domain-containing ribonuclease [Thermoanaerobaculia bacterium]
MEKASEARRVLRQVALDAMRERGFSITFPFDALAEANALREETWIERGGSPVQDLRSLPWFSIDNEGARTLDQLTCAEVRGSAICLFVAIADLDAFVQPGSALDRHAWHNVRSIYTPAERFPLFPEAIANNYASLRQGKDRPAVVVKMTVEEDGSVPVPEIRRARVCNQARLTYENVADRMAGKGGLPKTLLKRSLLRKQIELHEEIVSRLRRRFPVERRPFKPFFRIDHRVRLVQPGGIPARELVEDLMAATRQATALFLSARGLPSLRIGNNEAHGTAPNRRYADLVKQRLLKAALSGLPSPWPAEELEELAGYCTRREEDAAAVEQQAESAAAALMG